MWKLIKLRLDSQSMTFSILLCHSTMNEWNCYFTCLCDVWSLLRALEVNYPLSNDQEKLLMVPGCRQRSGRLQHTPFLLCSCFTVANCFKANFFNDDILSVSANLESYIVAGHKILRSSSNLFGRQKCDDLGPFSHLETDKLNWTETQSKDLLT